MTSAVWVGERGYPKSRGNEQNQLICDSDKGGRGQKIADVIYGSPLTLKTADNQSLQEGLQSSSVPTSIRVVGRGIEDKGCRTTARRRERWVGRFLRY